MTSTLTIRCALLAMLALGAAGCASVPASYGESVERDAMRIHITNNNWATAAVYAVQGGMRSRIGTVETGQTALLRLPWAHTDADIHVLVHLIGGGGDYVSPAVPRTLGDLALSVENHLALSSLSVR